MKKIIIAVLIMIFGLGFSLVFSDFFGNIYRSFIGIERTSGFDSLMGLPIAYLLFVGLLVPIALSVEWKWIAIVSIPALCFELAFDPSRLYFPFVFGAAGFGIGILIKKFISSRPPLPN